MGLSTVAVSLYSAGCSYTILGRGTELGAVIDLNCDYCLSCSIGVRGDKNKSKLLVELLVLSNLGSLLLVVLLGSKRFLNVSTDELALPVCNDYFLT